MNVQSLENYEWFASFQGSVCLSEQWYPARGSEAFRAELGQPLLNVAGIFT
ncbi:hypothetical protein SAMN05216248_10413 [Pseudomonas simiae]|nr:hypothetical protein SAMN05216248_10413 [Pseudomonas simiae]